LPEGARWASIGTDELGIHAARILSRKNALPFNDAQVPKTGSNDMITSVPQYDDSTALRQLVNEIMGEGKKRS